MWPLRFFATQIDDRTPPARNLTHFHIEGRTRQILVSSRVRMAVENIVKAELVGEFTIKGIRLPMAAYNVLAKSEM